MCRIKKRVSMENRICLQKTGGSVEEFAMEGKEKVATGAISYFWVARRQVLSISPQMQWKASCFDGTCSKKAARGEKKPEESETMGLTAKGKN